MQVNLRRRTVVFIIVLLLGLVGVLAQSASTAPATPSNTDTSVISLAQDLATAYGRGDLYRTPDKFPLTERLKAAIAKLPNKADVWPEFIGLAGEAVMVRQGKEADGRAFVDVDAHVLNRGTRDSRQLTQIDFHFVPEGNTWKLDRILTLAKGALQP